MNIEEIIERMKELETSGIGPAWNTHRQALREAIALLKTHPDTQSNEPLTLEELQEMVDRPVWVKVLFDEEHTGWWLLTSMVAFIRLNRYPNQHFGCLFEGYGNVLQAYRRPPKEDAELAAWLRGDPDETIDAAELLEED